MIPLHYKVSTPLEITLRSPRVDMPGLSINRVLGHEYYEENLFSCRVLSMVNYFI